MRIPLLDIATRVAHQPLETVKPHEKEKEFEKPLDVSRPSLKESQQAQETAQARKNESEIEVTARKLEIKTNLSHQISRMNTEFKNRNGKGPQGYGGPPGTESPAPLPFDLPKTSSKNDPFTQALERSKTVQGSNVTFGSPTSPTEQERRRNISADIERGSQDATRYSNQITHWSERSRMAHTIRYNGIGFRTLSKAELKDHPWTKRFDSNERAARLSFAAAKGQFQLADRALKEGKLDEAESHIRMGKELNRNGLAYDHANASDLAARREKYFGKGGRVSNSEETVKGYLMDTLGGEVGGRAIGWAIGKGTAALSKLPRPKANDLRQILTDEKLLAKETPESLYRKSDGQIPHDAGSRLIQAAKRAQEGLQIIPGDYKERLAHYAKEGEKYIQQAQEAYRRGDKVAGRELANKALQNANEASLLKSFVEETMGHVQVIARGGDIFQKHLPALRKMSNPELVDHLQKNYNMTRKQAAAVASDVRRMPEHPFDFYGHDQLGPGSKLMADVGDRLKYRTKPASAYSEKEFTELMSQDPKKAYEALNVDAGKDFHAQMYAHHRPESPVDWLEYGLDVNSAMRQGRAYKDPVPWERINYEPRNGNLFGITDPGQQDRAAGWLKLSQGIVKEIEQESGSKFVEFPQTFLNTVDKLY